LNRPSIQLKRWDGPLILNTEWYQGLFRPDYPVALDEVLDALTFATEVLQHAAPRASGGQWGLPKHIKPWTWNPDIEPHNLTGVQMMGRIGEMQDLACPGIYRKNATDADLARIMDRYRVAQLWDKPMHPFVSAWYNWKQNVLCPLDVFAETVEVLVGEFDPPVIDLWAADAPDDHVIGCLEAMNAAIQP
jgi:hypothetical protein